MYSVKGVQPELLEKKEHHVSDQDRFFGFTNFQRLATTSVSLDISRKIGAELQNELYINITRQAGLFVHPLRLVNLLTKLLKGLDMESR